MYLQSQFTHGFKADQGCTVSHNAISYDRQMNWPTSRPTLKQVTIALVSQLGSAWWPVLKLASQPVSKLAIIFHSSWSRPSHFKAGRPTLKKAGPLWNGLGCELGRNILYISHKQVDFSYIRFTRYSWALPIVLGMCILAVAMPEFKTTRHRKCKIHPFLFLSFFLSFSTKTLLCDSSIVWQAARENLEWKHCAYLHLRDLVIDIHIHVHCNLGEVISDHKACSWFLDAILW